MSRPGVLATTAGEAVHGLLLTPAASGQLFGAAAAGTPASEAIEAKTGQTAPFNALAVGGTALTSPQGAGFWEWKESVTAQLKPAPANVPPFDGMELSAQPMISLTSVTMPSSYLGESLTGLSPDLDATDFGTSNIFPGINLVTSAGTVGAVPVVQGEGVVIAKAQITGNILELNSWVEQWQPTNSVPKFNGSDYAKVRSEGFGRDNGAFEIQFQLKFHLKLFAAHTGTITQTYSIKVINNFDNDRDQYISDYKNAYLALDKVPEISERVS